MVTFGRKTAGAGPSVILQTRSVDGRYHSLLITLEIRSSPDISLVDQTRSARICRCADSELWTNVHHDSHQHWWSSWRKGLNKPGPTAPLSGWQQLLLVFFLIILLSLSIIFSRNHNWFRKWVKWCNTLNFSRIDALLLKEMKQNNIWERSRYCAHVTRRGDKKEVQWHWAEGKGPPLSSGYNIFLHFMAFYESDERS